MTEVLLVLLVDKDKQKTCMPLKKKVTEVVTLYVLGQGAFHAKLHGIRTCMQLFDEPNYSNNIRAVTELLIIFGI